MATGEEPSPLRIGHTERTAAIEALDEHLAAGRLGIDEYADRTAAATEAVLASDLAALFTDLPEPHPPLPRGATAPSLPVPPPADDTARSAWSPRIVPIAVIVAIGSFLVLRQGAVFVLIPLAFMVFWALRSR
jgi:hypothetical protein